MPEKKDSFSVGDKFGSLTIESFNLVGKNLTLIARCDCGEIKVFWKKSAIKRQNSCGCGINSGGVTGKQRRSWNSRFQGYKNGAKTRNLSWELSLEEFINVASQSCSFCGQAARDWECVSNSPSIRKDSPNVDPKDYTIKISGVDRLDNNLGYTLENSVPCCMYCNRAKSDMTFDQFKAHVERIYKWLSQKPKSQK